MKFSKKRFLASIKKRFLGKYTIGGMYSTKNGIFVAPIEDLSVGSKLANKGEYSLDEIEEVSAFIKPDSIVYILGAHLGTMMIPLSKKAKQVIAYEANPEIFPLLQANVMLNKCKNITVFNYAVGDDKKEVEFYLNRVNSGGSKIKPKIDQYMYHFDNPKTQVLSMICLDDHIEQEQLPSPDVVVMDIEGSEYYALKGMKNTLKNVNCLHIEYIPHHLKNVAGVSNQQFLECLLPYFDKMKVLNESIPGSEKEYQKDEFQKVLDDIEATDDNSNLLLYKS